MFNPLIEFLQGISFEVVMTSTLLVKQAEAELFTADDGSRRYLEPIFRQPDTSQGFILAMYKQNESS